MENHQVPTVQLVSELSHEAQTVFYRKAYSLLAWAILLFVLIEALFFRMDSVVGFALSFSTGYYWLYVLGAFIVITYFLERWIRNTNNTNIQYVALTIYIIAQAVVFVPLMFMVMYIGKDHALDLFHQAAVMTLSLFTGLCMMVFVNNKSFSLLKSVLTIGLAIAVGAIIAGSVYGFDLGLLSCVGMVLITAGAIVLQTSTFARKYRPQQYIAASFGLFASLMLLPWLLLGLLSRR